ncbi:MAG: hypothetical protein H6746_00715 [Deltaproteobacteria bacterium]|nr:hypothetical protein [Deltaproteobacteria bacterium]
MSQPSQERSGEHRPGHGPTDAVCFGGAGDRSAAELARDADALRAVLPAATPGSMVLLVFSEDRYAFAAALLASWAAGHAVLLPMDARRESVGPLQSAPGVAALFHDTKAGAATKVGPLLAAADEREAPRRVPELSPPPGVAAVFVDAFGARHVWDGPALMDAARAIAAAGGLDGRALVTVSPLTCFGLVAGVLAPLVAGGSFSRLIGEDADASAPTVVTVPWHLRTRRPLGPAAPTLGAAQAAELVLVPAEVPVGRETSRLALRPIAGLVDGAAPFLADRVDAVSRALVAEAGAEDAGALALPCAPGHTPRVLAAAASPALSPASARSALAGAGIATVERVIVESEIPRDLLGRLDPVRFLRLFGLGPEGAPLTTALELSAPIIRSTADGTEARVHVTIPEDYAFYAGHFPGYPILAGVVQLHELVMPAVARARPGLGELCSVTGVKFHKRILPGDRLELRLSWTEAAPHVDFDIRREDGTCAAGRVSYQPGTEPS